MNDRDDYLNIAKNGMAASQPDRSRKPNGSVLAAFIAMLVLGGILGAITWAAPVSHIELSQVEGTVQARVVTCLFVWIPIREELITPLTSVESTTREGERLHKRRGDGIHPNNRAVSQGVLTLVSGERAVDVLVSTTSLAETKTQVEAFLQQPTPQPLHLWTVGQYIAGYIVPLCLFPFEALFIIGFFGGLVQWAVYLLSPGEPEPARSSTT